MSPEARDDAIGVRVVVIYKYTKASIQLALGLVLAAGLVFGFAHELKDFAMSLHTHATGAWSTKLAEFLMTTTDHKHLVIAMSALLLDSAVSGFEGWALSRGHWWGPWLVVGATSVFLPWEILSLIRFQRASRLALFAVNLTIVIYLARHALQVRRKHVARLAERAAQRSEG